MIFEWDEDKTDEADEVIEMDGFSLTAGSFQKLQSELKAGKIVRNPFAKLYDGETTITVIKTGSDTDYNN